MNVRVYFDGDAEYTPHDFPVMPQVGNVLVWQSGEFTVEKVGFVSDDGPMIAAAWAKSKKDSVYKTRGIRRV